MHRRLLPLLTIALTGLAQAPGKPAAQFVFKTSSRLVVETVAVTDKTGKPIAGLTAKDFAVSEDGVAQTVAFCEYQKLDESGPAAAPVAAPPAAAESAPQPTAFAIAPETPGKSQYQDRRLLALYFDMTSMPVSDQLRALGAAQKFLKTQMGPADLVAVMVYQGEGVRVRQDFTSDRGLLGQALERLVMGTGLGFDETDADADATDTGSAFGQDDSEFNIFNTNRQLAALQTAVNMLAPLSEKKSLVYFASGINLNGVDNQAQLEAATNAAVRANVALFPVDARGLVANAPLGDATQGSPGGIAMYSGAAAQANLTRLQHTQDTLYALGSDTGGKALFDLNDLGVGIVQARDAITSYYILGYYTTNPALDGKYRRVKVSLGASAAPLATAKLSYREGYYPGKQFAQFTAADKERQLEDALLLGDPITDLTIDLEVNYFQLNSAEYFVPIAAKIPGSELALAKKGGAERSLIDFIGEVKDDYGTTVTNVRDKVELKLSGTTAAQLAKVPIEYTTGVTLLPGKYSIKLLARDAETGRIGTYLRTFTIPNLQKVADTLPISSVVLSSQRVALTAALFNAKKDVAKDAGQAANPLVVQGQELLPSVTRVFSLRAPLYVYLQAYERPVAPATVTSMRPLVGYVGFYRDAKKVYETSGLNVTSGLEAHSNAVPIEMSVPLTGLAPGRYSCQITVLDPTTHKAGYARAEIMVVP